MTETSRKRSIVVPIVTSASVLAGAAGLLSCVDQKDRENAKEIDRLLLSGQAMLWVDGSAIDITNQNALEALTVKLHKGSDAPVNVAIKHNNEKVLFACQIPIWQSAIRMLSGQKIPGSDVRNLVINSKELASMCGASPWMIDIKAQASGGDYSIKTDGAVAMGTIAGEVGQVRYT